MTRYVIAYEGRSTINGFFLYPGALRMTRDKIPVTVGFDAAEIIGVASALLRNEETGEVSVDIRLNPALSGGVAGLATSIAISDVSGDRKNVTQGNLRQISFINERLWD